MNTNKDSFFQVDEKIFDIIEIENLLNKYGFKGLGIWIKINCKLINNKGRLPFDYKLISNKRSDQKIVEDIILNFDLYIVENNTFYSEDIKRQLNERGKKSDLQRTNVNKRWNKEKQKTIIKSPEPLNNNDNYDNDNDNDNDIEVINNINDEEIKPIRKDKNKEIDEIFDSL